MNEPRVIESVTNECQSLGRAHESSSARAEQLIACLEGEIAKRDETIARLEPQLNRAIQANYDLREELAACRVAAENCEVFRARIAELEQDLAYFPSTVRLLAETVTEREAEINQLRAELAAIKAQDTVGEVVGWYRLDRPYEMTSYPSVCATWHKLGAPVAPLYAAPVSEAKAQGVVMPERLHILGLANLLEKEASLTAAPVQQVSVPASRDTLTLAYRLITSELKTLANGSAIDRYKAAQSELRAMIDAPAAPAADALLVEALDYQVLFDAIAAATSVYANGAINISVQAFRDALAAHRAKGAV